MAENTETQSPCTLRDKILTGGTGLLAQLRSGKNSRFCYNTSCTLLGRDVDIQDGVGNSTLSVKSGARSKAGDGCPMKRQGEWN